MTTFVQAVSTYPRLVSAVLLPLMQFCSRRMSSSRGPCASLLLLFVRDGSAEQLHAQGKTRTA